MSTAEDLSSNNWKFDFFQLYLSATRGDCNYTKNYVRSKMYRLRAKRHGSFQANSGQTRLLQSMFFKTRV